MPTVAKHSRSLSLAVSAVALVALSPLAQAMNFGDMFNPGRWFGGNDDDYYYDEGPYGPYGAPYGYGAPGYAPYGAPGYGYGPAPGYAAPGYAAPGYAAPTYAAPAAAPAVPAAGADGAKDREIEALKQRIEQLESRQGAPAPAAAPAPMGSNDGWPSAPAFRPVDQY
jgi:hypothetical protein